MCVYIPFNTTAGVTPIFESLTFSAGTSAPSMQFVNFIFPDNNVSNANGINTIFTVQATIQQGEVGLFDLDDSTFPMDVGQDIDSIVFTVIDDDCKEVQNFAVF